MNQLVKRLFPRTAMMLLMLLATAQTAWAQIPNVTYTVTGGTNLNGDESCHKLLDGDIHTKWCEYCASTIRVEFKSNLSFVPTGYILTTGDDNTLHNISTPHSQIPLKDQGDRSLIFYFERGRGSGVKATSVFSSG